MMKKQNKGITLIALVITIIVLLILAGVTIASITGENGILKQAQNAKIKTKISSVEEQINLRKTANKISEEESKSDDEFIDELIQKGYVDENEVDRESKTITIEDTVISYEINSKFTDIYVALYSDGTLVFSNNDEFTPADGVEIKEEYGNIRGKKYEPFDNDNVVPWKKSKNDITSINIINEIVPSNVNAWFNELHDVERIDNIKNLNTSEVTDMSHMFELFGTEDINLDLSTLNTSNVTNMSKMFLHTSANIINVSGFDTSKVTDMSWMFAGTLYAPTKRNDIIGLNNFNTSNVTTMENMFANTYGFTSLDLSSFDTSNVTNMSSMFGASSYEECNWDIKNLDLRNFNTSKVTNMRSMFVENEKLENLYINFDTSNVTDMTYMFYNCGSLTKFDCSKWNVDKVEKHNDFNYYASGVIAPNFKK